MFDFASRIAKLDAVSLDREFLTFLRREVSGLLSIITNEEYLQKFSPEITLLIKFVIWKFSTSTSGSTIGQKLLGIKYPSFPGKLRLLFLLEAVIPYIIERLNSVQQTPAIQELRDRIRQGERVCKILHVVNFCTFLFQNRYPTLSSRLIGLPMVPVHYRFGPSTGYTYQIRELLWHQFADFLIMTLPLINFRKIKRSVMNMIRGDGQASSITSEASGRGNASPVPSSSATSDDNGVGDVPTCCVCNEDAVIPQTVGGDHYCYFCYYSQFDENY